MRPQPISIESDRPVREAQAVMKTEGVRHLVVTEQGQTVGIVSISDLIRFYTDFFRLAFPHHTEFLFLLSDTAQAAMGEIAPQDENSSLCSLYFLLLSIQKNSSRLVFQTKKIKCSKFFLLSIIKNKTC